MGAVGTGIIALSERWPELAQFPQSLILATAQSTAMIFFIVLGAAFYNGFLALTQVPQELSAFVVGAGVQPLDGAGR